MQFDMQRATLLTVGVLFTLVSLFLSACSETTREVEEAEVIVPYGQEPVLPPRPDPDWADNEMSVTVRANKTGEDFLAEFREEEVKMGWTLPEEMVDPGLYDTKKSYTITVSVVTMEEIGLGGETASVETVRKRLKELGYYLFTYQEVMELRIQLLDQPHVGTDHPWSAFYTLPEKDIDFHCFGNQPNCVFALYSYRTNKRDDQGVVIYSSTMRWTHFDPNADDPHGIEYSVKKWSQVLWGKKKHGIQFAVITGRKYEWEPWTD